MSPAQCHVLVTVMQQLCPSMQQLCLCMQQLSLSMHVKLPSLCCTCGRCDPVCGYKPAGAVFIFSDILVRCSKQTPGVLCRWEKSGGHNIIVGVCRLEQVVCKQLTCCAEAFSSHTDLKPSLIANSWFRACGQERAHDKLVQACLLWRPIALACGMLSWMYRRMSLSNKQGHHVKRNHAQDKNRGCCKGQVPSSSSTCYTCSDIRRNSLISCKRLSFYPVNVSLA